MTSQNIRVCVTKSPTSILLFVSDFSSLINCCNLLKRNHVRNTSMNYVMYIIHLYLHFFRYDFAGAHSEKLDKHVSMKIRMMLMYGNCFFHNNAYQETPFFTSLTSELFSNIGNFPPNGMALN